MVMMFACFDDKTKAINEAVWEENEEKWNQRPMVRENNGVMEETVYHIK